MQRFFTNKIPGCTFLAYSARWSKLSLHSLFHRRFISDLCNIYSILSGTLITFLSPHLILYTPFSSRSHNLRILNFILHQHQSYQNIISCIVSEWNSLPPSTLASTSLHPFRNVLFTCIPDPYLNPELTC